MKMERGITLLALIITVIILIILVTVTVNISLGDKGLINQAKNAAEKTENSIHSEKEQFEKLMEEYNSILSEQKEKSIVTVESNNIELYYGDTSITNVNAKIEKGDGVLEYEVIEGDNIITIDQSGNIRVLRAGDAKVKISMSATQNFEEAEDVIVNVKVNKKTGDMQSTISNSHNSKDDLKITIDLSDYGLPEDRGESKFTIVSAGDIYINPIIDKNGVLTYSVKNPRPGDYTMTICIEMENYTTVNALINTTIIQEW